MEIMKPNYKKHAYRFLKYSLIALCINGCFSFIVYTMLSSYEQELIHLDSLSQRLFILCCVISCCFGIAVSTICYHIKHTQVLIESQSQSPFYSSHAASKSKEISTYSDDKPIKKQPFLTLLAIDDNPANLLILQDYLQHLEVIFLSANDGSEALTLLQENTVDLILMDIEMDGLDGISTTKIIRSIEKEKNSPHSQKPTQRIPIIGVSAHSRDEKIFESLVSGFDDYISKPVQQEVLFECLSRWYNLDTLQSTNIEENVKKTEKKSQAKDSATTNTQPSPQKKSRKVVDLELSLKHSNQNAELAKDMFMLLIQMIRDEKNNLQLHHQQCDWESLYQLNHKVYGGCSYCGIPRLLDANQQLESELQTLLHSGEPINNSNQIQTNTTIDHLVNELIAAIDEVIQWDTEHDIDIIFGIDEATV